MAFRNPWRKTNYNEKFADQEENYPDLSHPQVQQEMAANEAMKRYGRTRSIPGQKIGNAMIAADFIVPSGKLLTVGGLAAKKYVDKAKITYTDEHDARYKIPRVELYRR